MTESIDNNRRNFLLRLYQPIQACNSAPEITPHSQPRPPYAVNEVLFLRLCDNCGECQKACPNSVIEMSDGVAKLNLDYNECSLCGECLKACPTGALHASMPLKINLHPVFTNTCNNYLQMECQHCQMACPQAAISIEDGELPVLNEDLCNGCGQCRSSCYMGAISMQLSS